MLDSDVPDKFSIITYVSQFYHLLKVNTDDDGAIVIFLYPDDKY